MRRSTLAMTLGLALGFGPAFTGCGPSAEDNAAGNKADTNTSTAGGAPSGEKPPVAAPDTPTEPTDAGKAGGGAGPGGPPPGIMKGMESSSYRNMPGSQGPGEATKKGDEASKKEGEAKPADADKKDETKPAEGKADDASKGEPKKEEGKGDQAALTPEEIDNIKKLDAADQKLAMDQAVCLVGEEDGKPNHLGSMGKPVKEVVNGKTVFLCCKGCEDDLKKNPEKYLAKLKK